MSALHVPLTRPQLCGSVFMGWLIPATENGHILALPSTLPLQVSFSLFLSVYCPSLHLPMSNPVLSCGFVWKEKNQTPIKEKKKNTQNTILQVKILESSVGSLITWSLIFSLLSYQYSTLFRLGIWLSESFIKYNLFQHSVKTNRLLVEDPVVYVLRKRVTVGVHFMWSLLFQTEQMAEQNKHLYVNCCMFTCKSVTV